MNKSEVYDKILKEISQRILLLDGAMGTMIGELNSGEEDCKTRCSCHSKIELKAGCPDLLCLSHPEIVSEIHRRYLEAGADLIKTNSFNSNILSLSDYGLQDYAYEISFSAASIAKKEAEQFNSLTPEKPRFVVGTVGPTNKIISCSSDVTKEDSFVRLRNAFIPAIEGLIKGGADIILLETFFDVLNAKAAIRAFDTVTKKIGCRIPLMVSATISETDGRLLSGHTIETFYKSVFHADLLSVGLNCSYGPKPIIPHIARLSRIANCFTSCHPNAGLPNELGKYIETPATFARSVKEMATHGYVNIVGGCCGTTPEHIYEITKFIRNFPSRKFPKFSD